MQIDFKKDIKRMEAITLIALVITIVVLIILAAVAINLSLGNNGIFNRAKTAKEQYQNAEAQEEAEVAKYTNEIDFQTEGRSGGSYQKSAIMAKLSANYTTTVNPATISFDNICANVGDAFELNGGTIAVKKDIGYVSISVHVMCGTGFVVSEFPSVLLMKNNDQIISSGARFQSTSGEAIVIPNFITTVNKDDVIKLNFYANDKNRVINAVNTYITIEEL